ncbi:MAG: CZB domain-containing protein [Pseudomonadota bacterium]
MGLLAWLRRHDAGLFPATDTHLAPDIDPHEDLFEGLYLGQAVQGHLAWKKRLKGIVLEGRQDDADISQVASDDLCALGQWLHGHARQRYGRLPQYARLRKIHAEFHLTAGQVLLNSRNNQRDEAEKMLRGAFSALSDQVQLELVRFYAAARPN